MQEHQFICSLVIVFTVSLHGFAPRLGVHLMNVSENFLSYLTKEIHCIQVLTLFKIAILMFIVVTGKAITF